jgi:hypothetical protein
MRRGIRAARVALFVVAGLLLSAGVASAQLDPTKVLIGTWKGELQQRTQKDADPTLVLIIKSVKQEDGKMVAEGRFGPTEDKTAAIKIDIDTSRAKPTLNFSTRSGVPYSLNLMDEKNLVGTVQIKNPSSRGERERQVKLEKTE